VTQATDVSAYDRLVWPEGQVEQWLATGQHRRELIAYFGDAEYEKLRRLAIAAAAVRPDPRRIVIFVPGIMGTQLALPRDRPAPDNLLWLDPTDIQGGRLSLLAIPGETLTVTGPMLYTWLPLKLALHAAGFTMRSFAYDWRRDLAEAAAALARELAECPEGEISVIGHSMGGLVAHAALASTGGDRVRMLLTLGTPHGGSFAPVQAVRGVYPLVRRLAQLDPAHTPEALAREVFSSFHSLYQMLPRDYGLDLIEPRNWPRSGPQPNATLLARAPLFNPVGADPRIHAIAGHGFLTTVGVAEVAEEFWYRYEYSGDGTVPVARATLRGCPAWYCAVAHNELPRDASVQAAVVELLSGRRPAMAATPPARQDQPVSASDSQLRRQLNGKLDWAAMDPDQRRAFLDSLNAPPPQAG
jgi:pimeloyl-ACP methyl ester carboxylesterase